MTQPDSMREPDGWSRQQGSLPGPARARVSLGLAGADPGCKCQAEGFDCRQGNDCPHWTPLSSGEERAIYGAIVAFLAALLAVMAAVWGVLA